MMAGVYIHIPFCKQKCTYCDFHFSTRYQGYQQEMIDAMCREIELRIDELNGATIDTIYFGGGTPSLLTENQLEQLLNQVRTVGNVSTSAEITLETNPDDIQPEILSIWKKLGVNRLSIGIQSFRDADLQWMNRTHNAAHASQCVVMAKKAGFENLTVDLIYGLPGLTVEGWKEHVQRVVDLGVTHVSAYCLTVENHTVLANWVSSGKIVPATEQEQSEHFLALVETLEDHGIMQYEISNFAVPGFESRHNGNYWKGIPYLGIGPSAHSFDGTVRSWNIANNHTYLRAINEQNLPLEREILSKQDQFNELLMTGLRTTWGVSVSQLDNLVLLDTSFWNQVKDFQNAGLLEYTDELITLTRNGRLQADGIASALFQINA